MEQQNKQPETKRRGASALTRLLAPREICFRAISKNSGGYVYGNYWKSPDGTEYIKSIYDSHTIDFEVKPKTVSQFLGLTDTNGEPVYGGDIYKNLDSGLIGVLEIINGIGGYHVNCREYKDGRLYNNHDFARHDTTNFEVIGNIFETPELLE